VENTLHPRKRNSANAAWSKRIGAAAAMLLALAPLGACQPTLALRGLMVEMVSRGPAPPEIWSDGVKQAVGMKTRGARRQGEA
jgi:hypothetical protein